jgi:hypothetical protein
MSLDPRKILTWPVTGYLDVCVEGVEAVTLLKSQNCLHDFSVDGWITPVIRTLSVFTLPHLANEVSILHWISR